MEKQSLPLSGIFFRFAVLHAMQELKAEFPYYKESPPSESAEKIGERKTPRRRKSKTKK